MKVIEIDRPAAWVPIRDKGLNVKSYDAYRFMSKDGKITDATKDNPVQRYAKNYDNFSLIMITNEKDSKKVEAFMDKASKTFNSRGSKQFKYLDIRFEEKS